MNKWVAVAILSSVGLFGCKKQVPTDIVQKSLTSSLRHAPQTASAMCGATTRGLASSTITVTKRGEKNSGIAHVKGSPWPGQGVPSTCEGDVEFAYTYESKKIGRRTRTTWFLEHLKLTAVQTKGVTFKPVEEKVADDDDDN
jgi:hypothetical protein